MASMRKSVSQPRPYLDKPEGGLSEEVSNSNEYEVNLADFKSSVILGWYDILCILGHAHFHSVENLALSFRSTFPSFI